MKLNKSVQMAIGMLAMIIMAQGSAGTAVVTEGENTLNLTALPQSNSSPSTVLSGATDFKSASIFQPPSAQDIPQDAFGQTVKMGRDIFVNTKRYASQYVGMDSNLNCSSCHLDAGRLAHASPMWAAYVSYPAYRSKNRHVNTFAERLQGCFKYSMNGTAPPLGDPVLVALESYAYWLANGATIAANIPGRGYPAVPKPLLARDYGRGQMVFEQHCVLCHGADGAGRTDNNGRPIFPALWGAKSFNWGAGMASIKNAAGFIQANMPLGLGGTLSDQQAWDVATFMDSHERPQDPRFKGSIAATRALYHDTPDDMYGVMVNGQLLGAGTSSANHINH